jgi:hypothetical protein
MSFPFLAGYPASFPNHRPRARSHHEHATIHIAPLKAHSFCIRVVDSGAGYCQSSEKRKTFQVIFQAGSNLSPIAPLPSPRLARYFLRGTADLGVARWTSFFAFGFLLKTGFGMPSKVITGSFVAMACFRVSKTMQFDFARVTALYNKRRCTSEFGGIWYDQRTHTLSNSRFFAPWTVVTTNRGVALACARET